MGGPAQAAPGGSWSGRGFGEDNFYGGQQIAGAGTDPADYQSVQQYADAAHENARRYLDPQQAQQNRRFDQELINKGIDPTSPQGQEQAKMLAMQQADANNSAAFNSLGFGQGIQNQMFQQGFNQQQLAGDMQKALWQNQLGASGQNLQRYLGDQNFNLQNAQMKNQYNLGKAGLQMQGQMQGNQLANQRYGMDLNYNLGRSGQDLQRYGMDQSHQLGMGNLDLGRQSQNWNEMMGLEDRNFRNWQAQQGQQNWQDQFLMNMMGGGAMPMPGQAQSSGGAYWNNQQGPSMFSQIAQGVGAASGAIFSDRRLKENIHQVGEIDGVNLYEYNYIGQTERRIGPMAQEVPWAAHMTPSGYLAIDPRRVLK